MAEGCASTLAFASRPTRLRRPLLLLAFLSLGCVNLEKPSVLTHRDGSVTNSGGSDASTVIPGTGGAGPDSSGGTSGASGSGGTGSGGRGTGGVPADSGPGSGGNTETDALLAVDYPQATGGIATDAGTGGLGAGGSAGRSGGSGGAMPGLDAGAGGVGAGGSAGRSGGTGGTKLDAGSGGTAAGGTGVGGTTGSGGATGQGGITGSGGAEVRDVAPVLDTTSPDKPCALCAIGTSLVHRYSFGGTGTAVTDSVGAANGTVTNAQLSGSGTLVLAGGTSNQYADLPDGILSKLTSATLEIWVTWTGGNNNQRILDFGSNEQVNGKYRATTTVIISPNSAPEGIAPRLRASYSNQVSTGGTFVDSKNASALPTGSMQQIVAVFDGENNTIAMYLNGVLEGEETGLEALSLINDNNNWLGKSQYTDDPGFAGTYHEFRIYNAALTAEQVQAVFAAGTNASFDQ